MSSTPHSNRFHGRVGDGTVRCAYPGCRDAGDFRAPADHGRGASANGPGDYQMLCLDHVREFNARYDWFAGMNAEQISAAQSPCNVWASQIRAFSATANVDSPPKWADFHDPLDAISTRFREKIGDVAQQSGGNSRILLPEDRRALKTLGLGEDTDRRALRSAYSALVQKYHPDKNGGNRSHEKALQDVIAAYTHLKKTLVFT